MKEISVSELEQWRQEGRPHTLIDVREPAEAAIAEIGGTLIPLSNLIERADEIPTEGDVVIHCRSGKRSADAIAYLQGRGYDNLINLKGGILAWSAEIDPSVPRY